MLLKSKLPMKETGKTQPGSSLQPQVHQKFVHTPIWFGFGGLEVRLPPCEVGMRVREVESTTQVGSTFIYLVFEIVVAIIRLIAVV
jgi:hypothetical protein